MIFAFILRMMALPKEERADQQNTYGALHLVLLLMILGLSYFSIFFAGWE